MPRAPKPYAELERGRTRLRFFHGDAIDTLETLGAGSIDAIVTSPPYNLGIQYRSYDDGRPRAEYLDWTSEWIAAAKRTSELIPLCHPLPLSHIDVRARVCENGVELTATVTTTAATGVEMEALTAVSVAALTVYDMCKAIDPAMEITGIVLLEKKGGRRGHYRRAD